MRFSVNIPDNLDAWLTQQAAENSRSKNGQLVYLLDQARQKQPRRITLLTGQAAGCSTLCHYWRNDMPMENEPCNCGKVRW